MSETLPDNIFPIDPNDPDPAIIDKAAEHIRRGEVVVFPTRTLYGLAANALDHDAVNRIFEIKERPPDKPVLILINSTADLTDLVTKVPPQAVQIMDIFWPGGITLVFHALPSLPSNLTAGTGKIGVRMPLHPVARNLVKRVAVPVTGTSANLSGRPGSAAVQDIDPPVRRQVNLILDAGTLKGGVGSTIVDVTVTPVKILREGTVPEHRIREALAEPLEKSR